jgi:hypothetical protein
MSETQFCISIPPALFDDKKLRNKAMHQKASYGKAIFEANVFH